MLLDRDGVVNVDSPNYIKSPDEWHAIEGSLAAIGELCHAGITVCICSNQSGIARGLFDDDALEAINRKMSAAIAQFDARLDGLYYCRHHPTDHCTCRKPAPGLLLQALRRHDRRPAETVFVGDSATDLAAATGAGVRPILVRTGNGAQTEQSLTNTTTRVFDSLADVVSELLR
ncbi:MAG: D-glycero-beta-D-manno-heptose 1,7-bisphosphate 7-phosphatase [Pseudomonadaceae bacterium]|nr:D-glycero-beta-D-manno-heptose 1,7-bisphosphate 7-phosphatase [Pseudomonadaceae bacterium]